MKLYCSNSWLIRSPNLPHFSLSILRCHQYRSIYTRDEYANKDCGCLQQMRIWIQERAYCLQHRPVRGPPLLGNEKSNSHWCSIKPTTHPPRECKHPTTSHSGTFIHRRTMITGLYSWRWRTVTGPGTTSAEMNLPLYLLNPRYPHYLPHPLFGLRQGPEPKAAKHKDPFHQTLMSSPPLPSASHTHSRPHPTSRHTSNLGTHPSLKCFLISLSPRGLPSGSTWNGGEDSSGTRSLPWVEGTGKHRAWSARQHRPQTETCKTLVESRKHHLHDFHINLNVEVKR